MASADARGRLASDEWSVDTRGPSALSDGARPVRRLARCSVRIPRCDVRGGATFFEVVLEAPGEEPWAVGPQNVYQPTTAPAPRFAWPSPGCPPEEQARRDTLREWGRKRERKMHRRPRCLMDQMVSGSGLYPPRLLEHTWLSEPEMRMVESLEALLVETGSPHELAMDMLLTFRICAS